ncbi:MAG: hypothetical protein EZS28_008634 [Streblomastix strix]|uniref:Uncharacterized protein n=1 Tax=Streblomastix strix TaxID=222440 RepID=A0A5J4WLK0_9EUKA|nr:MAG: hypothetical protein EZS28_008634 [Streblomastix strix]
MEFMPRPEIEACLAEQSIVPPTFEKYDPRYMKKQDAFKIYVLSKQMAFEDLIQRFPAINNTFSKTEMQQKMNYAKTTYIHEESLRIFVEHDLIA